MSGFTTEIASGSGSSFGLALNDERMQAYGERAFQYFLATERERAARSGRDCALVLIELKNRDGSAARLPRSVGARLFAVLWKCVRETDFLGWYRDERIAGAVLTEVSEETKAEVPRRVVDRIRLGLANEFPAELSCRLDIRVDADRDAKVRS